MKLARLGDIMDEIIADEIVVAPEVMIKRKNVILDSQVLSSWMACKRLTDFVHNLNLRPINGKGHYLEMGSMTHHIMRHYYAGVRDGVARSVSIANAMQEGEKYARGIPEDEENYPGIHNCSAEEVSQVLSTAQQYFLHYANEHWVPILVEKVKSEIIYQDEEIRVLWKVKYDLTVDTNQGIYPVDHKTYSQRRDTLDLNNQFMGQCVIAKTNSMILNKIGFQKTVAPKDKFLRPMMSYSSDRLREWIQLVGFYAKEYADYQEAGFYPPNFTHCDKFSGCQFKDVCRSDRSMRETELKREFVVGKAWEPEDD